jgi:hypothetical protein
MLSTLVTLGGSLVYSRQLVRHWGRKHIEVIDGLINEDDHVIVGPFISGTTRGYTLITDHRLLMESSTWSSRSSTGPGSGSAYCQR